jgi:tRNA A37 methylthiotransferase MiaB
VARVRVSYLQPAETRPSLVTAMTSTPGVLPYFDLSFQHASGPLLRRMRRFGDAERFLELLGTIREHAPTAGVRSNVIVGFPGETESDVDVLTDFLVAAELDAVGVFGYSDEDGTEAVGLDGHVDADEIRARVEHVTSVADDVSAARAQRRVGERVEVLVEAIGDDGVEGRAACQGPEVDGSTAVLQAPDTTRIGDILLATVVDSDGVELVARAGIVPVRGDLGGPAA